jgi:hypothetical protein
LKESQFPRLFKADAACGEIRHTSIFKLDAGIRDVGLLRQHGNTHRPNFADGGRHEAQNNVDIVNHEIENNVDVEASRRERGKPMDFKKLGLRCGLTGGRNDGVEPLDMADLKDSLVLPGCIDQRMSLFERGRHWLLDENIDALLQEFHANSGVIDGRNRETDGVDVAVQVPVVGKWGRLVQTGDLFRPRLLDIDHTGKMAQLGIQPRMLLPQMPDTYYCHLNHMLLATESVAIPRPQS